MLGREDEMSEFEKGVKIKFVLRINLLAPEFTFKF
jgi:hypothetical protein